MRPADDTSAPERLDAWLPAPQVRTHHRRRATAPAGRLWEAASRVRLSETRKLGPLVRWRIPGLEPGLTYHELFRAYPFTVLEEGDGLLVSGLCGRIWTLHRDYPRLDGPEDFAAWREPGTVRVLFGHWVRADGDEAELVSEARVEPTDRLAAMRLRALWSVIGPFDRLVAAEPLALAARRASDGSA
jgi:hypothetical protein